MRVLLFLYISLMLLVFAEPLTVGCFGGRAVRAGTGDLVKGGTIIVRRVSGLTRANRIHVGSVR